MHAICLLPCNFGDLYLHGSICYIPPTCVPTHTQTHTCTLSYTLIHMYLYRHMNSCICHDIEKLSLYLRYMYATHTHTNKPSHTHTHIHTHTHPHTHIHHSLVINTLYPPSYIDIITSVVISVDLW